MPEKEKSKVNACGATEHPIHSVSGEKAAQLDELEEQPAHA